MATVNYSVALTDPLGNRLDLIDDWLSLSYTRAVNDVGVLELQLEGDYDTQPLKLDSRLIVQRAANSTVYPDTETCFFVRGIEKRLSRSGVRTITVTGLSAVELLKRRIINYDSGTSYTDKSGAADDIIKEFVAENLGSSATNSSRDISTYLDIQADSTLGPTVSYEASRDNLLSVCQEISQKTVESGSAVYFDVVAPTESTLEFRTYRGARGLDHSAGTDAQVIFSPNLGNLVEINREYDWTDEVTVAYVGSTGTGGARTVTSASSTDRVANSPFNWREQFVSATNSSGDQLTDQGQAALRAGRPRRILTGEAVSLPGTSEYGVHWKFGDIVTAEYEGEEVDCMIEAITVTYIKGKEMIRPKLRALEE